MPVRGAVLSDVLGTFDAAAPNLSHFVLYPRCLQYPVLVDLVVSLSAARL